MVAISDTADILNIVNTGPQQAEQIEKVSLPLSTSDLKRVDAQVAKRTYGKTRAGFIREVLLKALDAIDAEPGSPTRKDSRNGSKRRAR